MDHDKVIKALEALIPQGAKSNPENVIIKYASEQNLAPAQLERIAQMYNVAMTINFMNKSASRGDTFQLIDTESLMAKYTDHEDTPKSANIPAEWASWFEVSTMDKAASTFADGLSEMPDIVAMAKGMQSGGTVTFENDVAYPSLTLDSMWDSFRKESFDKYEVDSVKILIEDSEDNFRKCANKIRDLLQIHGASFSQIANDTIKSANVGDATSVVDQVAGYLNATRCNVTYELTAKSAGLIRDEFNAISIMEEAAQSLESIKAARSYLDMYEKEAFQLGGDALDTLNKLQGGGSGNKPNKSGKSNKPKDNEGKEKKELKGPATSDSEEEEEARPSNHKNKDNDNKGKGKDSRGGGPGGPPGGPPKGTESSNNFIGSLAQDTMDSGKRILNPDTYFGDANSFDGMLKNISPNKMNSTQRHIDGAVSDVANVTTLQRLLMTDPIISEADPNTVIQLYNTLQRANPEIASDPNVLRFALREAIQYDAIPMHTYKDFVETDQKRQQADKDRNEVTNNRYRI